MRYDLVGIETNSREVSIELTLLRNDTIKILIDNCLWKSGR